ncbi:MAG: hypothetical protein WBK76_01905 [Candidatus Saccharimonadales bacterium]
MDSNFVLVLTGPTGSGKSTVGERVAKGFEHCVNIDTDHVKHMIVSGFYEDPSLPAGGDFTEWELTGESIGLLAANFISKGYSVVINGAIHKSAWQRIEETVPITHKLLLMPELDENLSRDNGRSEQDAMGAPAVIEHQKMFSTAEYYRAFQKIDTTNQSIDETVNSVLDIIKAD